MRPLKLITESIPYDMIEREYIEESDQMFFSGPFVDFAKNRNGRRYVRDDMLKEAERYTKEAIDTKMAWGELDHPQSTTINASNVSHIITQLIPEENYITGKAKIVNTEKGKIAKILMKEGNVGISTRGVGEVLKDGVVANYRWIASDLVLNPSGLNCYVEIVHENIDYMIENGMIIEASKLHAKQKSAQQYREELLEQMAKFFKSLKVEV